MEGSREWRRQWLLLALPNQYEKGIRGVEGSVVVFARSDTRFPWRLLG